MNVTDVIEAPAAETTTTVGGRRGRPRPAVTLQRDEDVFMKVTEGVGTRRELTEHIDATSGQVYLSLYRLRLAGRIARVRENGKHIWRVTAPDAVTAGE